MRSNTTKTVSLLRDTIEKGELTRRAFLGSAIALPVVAHAGHLGANELLQAEDVDLDISHADGLLKVAIQRGLSRERRTFWMRLGVNAIAQPEDTSKDGDGPVWTIATARFGPNPKLRLRNIRTKAGRRRYTVTINDVTYGRVADRRVRFIFEEHLERDVEGEALLEQLKAQPESHGKAVAKRLEKLKAKNVPMRRIYSIRATTDLWSLRIRPQAKKWFELVPPKSLDEAQKIGNHLRLKSWIESAPKRHLSETTEPGPFRLELLVDAGRITSTLKLVFNGQVGYADKDAGRNVLLSFDQTGTWRVTHDSVKLTALVPGLTLDDFILSWQPFGGEPTAAPLPKIEAADETDDKFVNDKNRTGPGDARDGFGLTGRASVSPKAHNLALSASKGAPGLKLELAGSDAAEMADRAVVFRVLEATQIEAGKIAPGQVRSEASLLTNWTRIELTGEADATAGPFTSLRGRLLERVDAPAKMDDFDYARAVGNISFGADFTGPAARHWRVSSPIGPLGFRGFSPEDDATNGDAGGVPAKDDPFRERYGDQVQVVFSWGKSKKRGFAPRKRPRTDWIELNGVLREAAVKLEGADFNRLTLAPTHLTFIYTPGDLPPPQTSYIRLAPPKEVEEVAQIDLSDASLVAARTDNLLGLTFRFADFALSMQRGKSELVRRNAACRITTDREPDGSHEVRDTRPVLVVEFPGQHLFEEAFFAPRMQDLPDVSLDGVGAPEDKHIRMEVGPDGSKLGEITRVGKRVLLMSLGKEQGWVLNPNDRQQVTELLSLMRNEDQRVKFRTNLKTEKEKQEILNYPKIEERSFAPLAKAYLGKHDTRNRLPKDQEIYIGPFALDPDAMRLAGRTWKKKFDDLLAKQATRLLTNVRDAARELHEEAKGLKETDRTEEQRRIAKANSTFEGALALEQRLEAQYPSYQLFRTIYRDMQITRALAGKEIDVNAIAPERLEAVHVDHFWSKEAERPAWMQALGLTLAMVKADRDAAAIDYAESLKGKDAFKMPARARIANPSRLAFRVRCRDGISVVRNEVETLDIPADAPAQAAREKFEFTLSDLTRFSDFDLSVVRRAETIYRPSETGRIDVLSRRRLDLSHGARLDRLGFTSGPFVTAETRLGEIAASLKEPPRLRETAIEIPARLTLSPDQNAVVVAHTGVVPPGIYYQKEEKPGCDAGSEIERMVHTPLWAAEFLASEVDPNLRAVHSPDLRPDVFAARSRSALLGNGPAQGKLFPGGGAPPRGPLAPWHLGAHATQTIAMGPGDVPEPLPTQPPLRRLFAYLAGEKARILAVPKQDLRFRAAIDAYARHELVLLSSAWGLPVLGRRTAAGQIVANGSQSEVELRYQLMDVEHGSAFYEPRTLGTVELALTPIGGTLRHASSFEPFAAAFDSHGTALFDATSVENWQQWTNLGRDVHCEIVYKGFLWPIGQRASLIQVTEREFFIDSIGAIRAVLRQRLFIRVGKAEKLFPALKQPTQGRRFPVERLRNLTTQTPDIVDPSDNPVAAANDAPTEALASGRVWLGQGTKGLAFWPRTAKLPAANVRFELDLDGTLTDLPLLFVDNVAANDAATLKALATYYNNAINSPDPLDAGEDQVPFDPLEHLRTLDMGGGKRRYAAEKETGSASCETQLWTLCATGLQSHAALSQQVAKSKAKVWAHEDDLFRSDPLLQGADQPPFYPALESCRIRARQAERLIGGPLTPDPNVELQDPRFLRATFDGHYIQYGLPAASGAEGPVDYALQGNVAETYLAMIDQPRLGMGDKGDQAGGVYRPSGHVVGLSRNRGVLTWAAPIWDKSLSLDCARLLSVAGAFEIGVPVPQPKTGGDDAKPSSQLAALCTEAPAVVIDPKVAKTIKDAQKLYSDIVDGNAKILGLVSIKDLFEFIQKLDPPKTGMPKLAEQAQYGAKEVQSAIGQVDDAVGDALSKLDETVDLVRTTVIVPLAEAVHDIREGWDELDRDIKTYTKNVPAGLAGEINFAKIFPDLHCTLVAFDAALARAVAAAEAITFTLAVSEVFAAGRRFLDALFRAASDPGRRLEAGLKGGVEGILGLVAALQEGRFDLVLNLATKFLSEDNAFVHAARIAFFVATGENKPGNFTIKAYGRRLAQFVIPEGKGASLPLFLIPVRPENVPEEIWRKLQPPDDELRDIYIDIIVFIIQQRGEVTFKQVLALNPTGLSDSVARWLKARAEAGLELAKADVEKIADQAVKDAAKAALEVHEETLERFETRLFDGAEVKASAAARLEEWLTLGFADEWNLLRDSERLVRQIVAAIDVRDLDKVFTSIRTLAELHFGPLIGLDKLCEAVFEPFGLVAKAINPGTGGLHKQTLISLDAFTVQVGELREKVSEGRTTLQAANAKLRDKEVTEPVAKMKLPEATQALNLAVEKTAAFGAELSKVDAAVGLLVTALEDTRADVKADRDQLSALATRLAKFEGRVCKEGDFSALKDLTGLHRDFRALIDLRRAALMRLSKRLENVAQAAETVLSSDVLQEAAALAAAVAALDKLLGFDKLAKGAKDIVTDLGNKFKVYKTDLRAQADAYAKQLGIFLATVAGELSALLNQLHKALWTEQADATTNIPLTLRELFGAEVSKQINTALVTLLGYIEWLNEAESSIRSAAEGAAPAKALAMLEFAAPDKPKLLAFDFFKDAEEASLTRIVGIEEELTEKLLVLEDKAALLFREVRSHITDKANDGLKKMLNADIGLRLPTVELEAARRKAKPKDGNKSFVLLYQDICDLRNVLYDNPGLEVFGAKDTLLARPRGRGKVGKYEPATPDQDLNKENDRLAGDAAWLSALAKGDRVLTADKTDQAFAFVATFLSEWQAGQPTPVAIIRNVEDLVSEILKGDLFAAIDFTDLRRQVEDYILSLVPTQIDMSYSYGVELGDNVRKATMGIFAPGSGSKLTIEAGIAIDIGFGNSSVHAKTVGRLGPFDVKLVGDAFDALTLKFTGAVFTSETGKKMKFDISYSDYEIGPMLEFVQQFQSFLSPKGNSGFYLEPKFSPLGVEAGYILNLGDFSIGAMAISNVGLATGAVLPFEDKDARFRASLSTRMSPFTITYTPYGGSGFFAIEANANGILGFEAAFEFGGSAVFAFGPLTGKGRLMAGFYIRQSVGDNGQKLTELNATFFVGGTAQIWIFSFAASLSVRLGMVNGNMSGEAIFSFSFSMGLADFEYSIVLFKKEAKGFGGQEEASLYDMPFGGRGVRFADLGMDASGLTALADSVPRIDTDTACQVRSWKRYAKYFTDDIPGDIFA